MTNKANLKNLIDVLPPGGDGVRTVNLPKKRGGARPGSGRKKKAIKYASQNEYFNFLVDQDFDELYRALKDCAMGHFVEETDLNGNTRVYVQKPNPDALKYIMNRRLGVPVSKLLVGGSENDQDGIPPVMVLLPQRNEAPKPEENVIEGEVIDKP